MFGIYGKLFSLLRQSFAYSGRSPRKDFWFFLIFYCLMFFAALGADVTYFQEQQPTGLPLALSTLFGGAAPFVWLHLILLTPAMVALTIRRLHDVGHNGWWGLVYLIPVAGLVPMFVMLLRTGQPGFNRFGTNPLDLAAVAAFDQSKVSRSAPGDLSGSVPSPAE
ncbi:DUF805 domain-containing protein [uncultured Cohaesibacter sp.]|uniref:DUF805 domain-containing protein n=1 Tax=uncultured Cohaesibacter sp. TaxID=1002546 RepID=UPI00293082D2|nr:DUF805 domain-containing protein [uncultured Cohaesibacter sp.]